MFEIPEDINALDADDLRSAIDDAVAEAADLPSDPAELTDDQAERLVALSEFVTAGRAEVTAREDAAAERAERIAAARSAITPVEEPAAEEEPTDEEGADGAKAEAKEVVVAAASAGVTSSGKAPRRQVVAKAAGASAQVTTEVETIRPTAVLTASADVPGFAAGSGLDDLDHVGKAMLSRMDALPKHRIGGKKGVQNRHSVAQIDLSAARTDGLTQTNFGRDDMALLNAARREARLPGGSLVAAGGWCAPSETLYDLCQIATTEGLIDLPSIQINRGGIRYTSGPNFNQIFEDVGFCLTEQEVIDGELKTCIEVDCPEFVEERMDACGLCIRAGILTNVGYPEYVRSYIENALIAHQHKMSKRAIDKILADSTPLDAAGAFPTTVDSLGELELVAQYQRQAWRMSYNESMEILLPFWYKTVVRADLARRGGVDLINVSDAQIDRYFADRMLHPQWLYNLFPLTQEGGEVSVPAQIEVPMYPAGTWIHGTTDVISLDAVYDSQSLLSNTYTALFAEEGWLLVPMCYESVKVTINTCATGQVGAADLTDCVFAAATS